MTDVDDGHVADGSTAGYVDTPYGIVTAAGRWYHVTEEDVRDYAGEVLEYVSLEQLLSWADEWADSARTVLLWLFPAFLWLFPVEWAVGAALVLYVTWLLVSPALPAVVAVQAIAALDRVLLQGVYYVITLSALAAAGLHGLVGAGLAGFVLLRWGILEWAFSSLVEPLRRELYPLPVADQILRGLIVRVALKHRLSVPQVNEMTRDIIENWSNHQDADDS